MSFQVPQSFILVFAVLALSLLFGCAMKPGYGIWDPNYTYTPPHPIIGCWKATGPDVGLGSSIIFNINSGGTFSSSVGQTLFKGKWDKIDDNSIMLTYADPVSGAYVAKQLKYERASDTIRYGDYKIPFYRC